MHLNDKEATYCNLLFSYDGGSLKNKQAKIFVRCCSADPNACYIRAVFSLYIETLDSQLLAYKLTHNDMVLHQFV